MFTPVPVLKKRAIARSGTPSAPTTPTRSPWPSSSVAAGLSSPFLSSLGADSLDEAPTRSVPIFGSREPVQSSTLEKSDRHSISIVGAWPDKLRQEIKPNLLGLNSAVIDAPSGVVLLIHGQTCYQWIARKPNETLRRFPLPSSASRKVGTSGDNHFVCLTKADQGVHSMGLLACSADGVFRYWERLTLTATDEFLDMTSQLDLRSDNPVISLTSCEPAGYIAVTRDLSIYRISLVNATGQLAISYAPLSRPLSVFSRFGSLLGLAGSGSSNAPFVAVAAGTQYLQAKLSRDMFVLTQESLQRWEISEIYYEKFLYEDNVVSVIQSELNKEFDTLLALRLGAADGEMLAPLPDTLVHLIDLNALQPQAGRAIVAVLVAFAVPLTEVPVDVQRCLRYAIVSLDVSTTPFKVLSVRHLEHRVIYQPFAFGSVRLLSAKLYTCNGGIGALITAPSFYTLSSIIKVRQYDVTVSTTDGSDRVVGGGTDRIQVFSQTTSAPVDRDGQSTFYLLTLAHGVIKLEQRLVPLTSVSASSNLSNPSTNFNEAYERMRSKLQVFVFSAIPGRDESPLSGFQVEEILACLDQAALDVSAELVTSGSRALPPLLDMRLQLGTKLERLMRLMRTIHSNGGLQQLRPSTQQTLYESAEKLAAAGALWAHQNTLFKSSDWSSNQTRFGPSQLLMRTLVAYYNRTVSASSPDEDKLRLFFQSKVLELDISVLEDIQKAAQERLPSASLPVQLDFVKELNTITMTFVSAALKCRDELYKLFGPLPIVALERELWTATQGAVDALQRQVQLTDDILRQLKGVSLDALSESLSMVGADSNDRRVVLIDQLVGISERLLTLFQDRIVFLQTATIAPSIGNADAFLDRYREYRPRLLTQIDALGRRADALRFGERFTLPKVSLFPSDIVSSDLALDHVDLVDDLSALVLLCLKEDDPEHQSTRAAYLRTFGLAFAFPLFSSFISQGQRHRLLTDPARLLKFSMPLRTGGERLVEALSLFLHCGGAGASGLDLQWIHALDPERGSDRSAIEIAASCKSLITVAEDSINNSSRKSMLSIAKLLSCLDPSNTTNPAFSRIKPLSVITKGQDAINEVFATYGPPIAPYALLDTFFSSLLSNALRDIQDGKSLPVWQLVEVLTLLPWSFGTVDEKTDVAKLLFPHAIDIVRAADDLNICSPSAVNYLWGTIWRRVLLVDNWRDIEMLENEEQRLEALGSMVVGTVLPYAAKMDIGTFVDNPQVARCQSSLEDLNEVTPALTHTQWLDALEKENQRFDELIENGRIAEYLRSVYAACQIPSDESMER